MVKDRDRSAPRSPKRIKNPLFETRPGAFTLSAVWYRPATNCAAVITCPSCRRSLARYVGIVAVPLSMALAIGSGAAAGMVYTPPSSLGC